MKIIQNQYLRCNVAPPVVGTDGNNKDGSEGNFYARFLGPRSLSKNPDYKAGYGFLLPTEELYKYFLADDTKRRDAVVFTYDDLVTKPNEQITEPAKKG